jgi:hypothetical protein
MTRDHGDIRPARGRARLAVAALAALLLLALPAGAAAAAAPAHPSGKTPAGKHRKHHKKLVQRPTYWGAWIGDQLTGQEAPWDMNAVSVFSQLLGKGLSLVEFSSPMADCHKSPCTFYEFPTPQMEQIRAYGAIPVFSWSTSSSPYQASLEDPEFQLGDIIAGTYDRQIYEFASAAARWGHPFFLRFDWEMNGNWMPWSEGVNGNTSGQFVAAWHHVHDIFRAAGATNATWIWCPYVDIEGRFQSLRSLYPGNAYVDWVGLDGFNWAQNPANPQKWRNFNQIFASTYRQVTTKIAPKKPVVLPEMATGGAPKAKAQWIRKMFELLRTDYRRIRAVIYFNKVDRGVQWPLETSGNSLHAFAKGIHARGFRANTFAELPPGPVKPPR